MKTGTVLVLLLLSFIGFLSFRNQRQEKSIVTLTRQRDDSTGVLRSLRDQFGKLTGRTTRLETDSAKLAGQKAELERRNAESLNRGNTLQNNLNIVLDEKQKEIERASAARKKQEADRPAGGVGAVATVEADTANNRDFGILKNKYRYLSDTVVPQLIKDKADLTVRAEVAESKTSELEDELNGFKLNAGNARTNVQNKVTKASKGLVKKVFNQGKIKALTDVDRDLQKVQSGQRVQINQ